MNGIDTRVDGEPGSVEAAARWLSGPFTAGVREMHGVLLAAGQRAAGSWRGRAGDAFGASVERTLPVVEEIERAAVSTSESISELARVLREVQAEMAAIRDAARSAGLSLWGDLVLPPSGGNLGLVGPIGQPVGLDAYAELERRAAAARERLVASARELDEEYRGLTGAQWAITGGQFAAGVLAPVVSRHAADIREVATSVRSSGRDGRQRVQAHAGANGFDRFYPDYDHYKAMEQQGEDMARTAKPVRIGGFALGAGGGMLTGVGMVYDIHHGKPVKQAAASGSAGLVAGVGATAATGALIGTAVVPVFGTTIGAVIGVGVGTVASVYAAGAVDAGFEEGADVGTVNSGGWDAVTDTAGAVVDGVEAAGDGIESVIGSVGPAVAGLAGGFTGSLR